MTICFFSDVSETSAKRNYNYETKIGIHFIIECDSNQIKLQSNDCYMNHKIEMAMKQTLNVSDNNALWVGQSDIFYNIECYYISNQSFYNKLVIYNNIFVYTMELTNKNVITSLSKEIINMMNRKKKIGAQFHNVN